MKIKDKRNFYIMIIGILLLVILTLILGILSKQFTLEIDIFSPIATLIGALLGALLSGIFATNIFEKQIKYQYAKENKESEANLKLTKIFLVQSSRTAFDYKNTVFLKEVDKIGFGTDMDGSIRVSCYKEHREGINDFINTIIKVKRDVLQYITFKKVQIEEQNLVGETIVKLDTINLKWQNIERQLLDRNYRNCNLDITEFFLLCEGYNLRIKELEKELEI